MIKTIFSHRNITNAILAIALMLCAFAVCGPALADERESSAAATSTAAPQWPHWSKLIGSPGIEWAKAVAASPDGSLAFAGYSKSSDDDTAGDVWVSGIDASGTQRWSKTFGGDGRDEAFAIAAADGGWVIAGETESETAGGDDAYIIRIDSSGNKVWERKFGGAGDDRAYSVQAAHGGGYIVAGVTNSEGQGCGDAWILKIDEQGYEDWHKTFGGPEADWMNSIRTAPNGGYIAAGATMSYGEGDSDYWALRLDDNGIIMWTKTYGGPAADTARDIVPADAGGFVIAGDTQSFGAGRTDFWIIKIDSKGREIWSRTSGGPGADHAHAVAIGHDGIIAAAGDTLSFSEAYGDARVLLLDHTGIQIKDSVMGGDSFDTLRSISSIPAGGWYAAGHTLSFFSGGDNAWLLRLDPDATCKGCF